MYLHHRTETVCVFCACFHFINIPWQRKTKTHQPSFVVLILKNIMWSYFAYNVFRHRINRCRPILFYVAGRYFKFMKPAINDSRKDPFAAVPLTLFAFIYGTKVVSLVEKKQNDEESLKSIIVEADDLYAEDKLRDVYNLLYPFKDSENVEILWRLARVMYNLTKQSCAEQEKKSMTYEAYDIMHKALNLDDNSFAVHKWYSVLLDAKASYDGTKERVTQLLNVKKHMLRAVELNPKDATTFYMLGFWCYNIASMPWYQRKIASAIFATPPTSTYEEALYFFKKAEEVNPNFYSQNLLMLGKTLLKLGKQEQALYYLKLAASYPMRTAEDLQVNKEANQLLGSLKRK